MSDAGADSEAVGSIAEEAVKLFRALAPNGLDSFVRQHPEAVASVTQSATALARSLRDIVDTVLASQSTQEHQ